MSTFVTANYGRSRARRDRVLRGLSAEGAPWKASRGRRPLCRTRSQLREELPRQREQPGEAGTAVLGDGRRGWGRLVRLDPQAIWWRRLAPQMQWQAVRVLSRGAIWIRAFWKVVFFLAAAWTMGQRGARVEMERLDRRLRQSSVVAGTRPGRE